jgi:hypothetical protein
MEIYKIRMSHEHLVIVAKSLNTCYRGVKHLKPMKKLLLLPLVASLFSVPVQAQQVNDYQICTKYREVYNPGYYDRYGNYVQGNVSTQSYQVPCGNGPINYQPRGNGYVGNNYYGRGYCNPTQSALGALLGGGVGAALSRGDGRWWAVPVGAAVGGAMFGCN